METSLKKKPHYGLGHIKRLKARAAENQISKPEYIELLLSYVIKGRDIKPQAKEIYKKCRGNFRELFRVFENEKIPGVGPEVVRFFALLKKFIGIYSEEKFMEKAFRAGTQQDIIEYFKTVNADAAKEYVYALFLDAKNKIIGNEKVSEGTLTQSILYPREIIKSAINKGALSIIVVHNHPSGDPAPSENDRKITRKLLFAVKEMDMSLLDHIIVGGNRYYSFYEEGLIERYNGSYRYLTDNSGV